jgi:energy-converting hydrogenase A subunit R
VLIFFDLEGPLSPQDNAYELMKLFPQGGRIFEVISRYDDLLTIEGKEGYEPGDTLALIVPFLVHHDIAEEDIVRLAEKATLVEGAPELVARLRASGWQVFCISTSYEQYAHRIAQRVGINPDNVACTRFPLNRYRGLVRKADTEVIELIEQTMLAFPADNDEAIKRSLDLFFWEELPRTSLGIVLTEVKPVGGRRKVAALEGFARACGQTLEQVTVVGDSITDAKMLEAVNRAGGLAIAFNANEYALPHATLGLASTHLSDLGVVLKAWEEGGRETVEQIVKAREKAVANSDRENFHWLAGRKNLEEPLKIHKRIRRLVREEAGKLG